MLENFRRVFSLDPTDCPWVSFPIRFLLPNDQAYDKKIKKIENKNQEANDIYDGLKRDYGMHYKFGSLQGRVSNVRSDFFLA